jgi:hypothetical protein
VSVSNNGKAILAATRELNRKWQETRNTWRDSKAEEFERRFMADLIGEVERTIPVLEELDRAIAEARRACE